MACHARDGCLCRTPWGVGWRPAGMHRQAGRSKRPCAWPAARARRRCSRLGRRWAVDGRHCTRCDRSKARKNKGRLEWLQERAISSANRCPLALQVSWGLFRVCVLWSPSSCPESACTGSCEIKDAFLLAGVFPPSESPLLTVENSGPGAIERPMFRAAERHWWLATTGSRCVRQSVVFFPQEPVGMKISVMISHACIIDPL